MKLRTKPMTILFCWDFTFKDKMNNKKRLNSVEKTAKHKASISFNFKFSCLLQINKVNSDISENYLKNNLEMFFRQAFA